MFDNSESRFSLVPQAGVTILEFIAFIGLAAIVIAGALGLYSNASTTQRAQEITRAATGLLSTARAAYATSNVSNWALAAQNVSAPTGWSGGANNATKPGLRIEIGEGKNTGTMKLTLSTSDTAVCNAIRATINGVTPTSNCSGTNANVSYDPINP